MAWLKQNIYIGRSGRRALVGELYRLRCIFTSFMAVNPEGFKEDGAVPPTSKWSMRTKLRPQALAMKEDGELGTMSVERSRCNMSRNGWRAWSGG